MARLKEIVADKLYVGYNFIDAYYYVINQDTITSRLTAKEAYDIVLVIDPEADPEETLQEEINAMATTLETLTNIYYALEDEGLGIRAVWFNTYRYYPILYDGNTMSIGNTDVVYTISTYSIRDKIVKAIQNFYLTKIGINITLSDLTALYNYLVNTSFNKPVYNTIADRDSTSDPLYYSNQLSTLTDAKVTYVATYNPEEEYTYTTVIGNVKNVDRTNSRIVLEGTPAVTLSAKDKVKLDGATLYMSGVNYTDDDIYTVSSIEDLVLQDANYQWHNNSVGYADLLSEYNNSASTSKKEYTTANFYKVGTPTIEEGVASGFSTSNYLTTKENFAPTTQNFEFLIKFTTGDSFSVAEFITATQTNQGVSIGTSTAGKLLLYVGSGTAWVINALAGTTTLTASTEYYVKLTRVEDTFTMYLSTDGTTFIQEASTTSTTSVSSGANVQLFGISRTMANPFTGSIDLKESYIKINDELWWQGYDYIEYKQTPKGYKIAPYSQLSVIEDQYLENQASSYYMFGSLTNNFRVPTSDNLVVTNQAIVVEEQPAYDYNSTAYIQDMNVDKQTITLTSNYSIANLTEGTQIKVAGAIGKKYLSSNITKVGAVADVSGVLSNFTTANYANTPTINFNSADNWEIGFKTVVNSNLTTNQTFIGYSSTYPFVFRSSTNGKFQWYVSSNSSSWNIINGTESSYLLQASQPYWIKLKFTGSQYIMEYSTDGTEYNVGICVNSTSKVHANFNLMRFGVEATSNPLTYGSIDLNESYVKLNDETVWTGTNTQPYTNDETYTVVKSYINDDYNTEIIVNNTLLNNYTASQGVYPIFDLATRPTTKKGTANSSILLNVTKSINEEKFPTGEFMLDSPSQLTSYIQLANAETNNAISVPTDYNYNHFNTLIPSSISSTETGLSKDMELVGLFTEVYSDLEE